MCGEVHCWRIACFHGLMQLRHLCGRPVEVGVDDAGQYRCAVALASTKSIENGNVHCYPRRVPGHWSRGSQRVRGRCIVLGEPAVEHLEEIAFSERLAEEVVHSRCETTFAITAQRVRRERDDGHASAALRGADRLSGLQAIEHRQMAIHQHHRVGGVGAGLRCRGAVLPDIDLQPGGAEKLEHYFLVDDVVLHQQHATF